jgi:hypothetical protein
VSYNKQRYPTSVNTFPHCAFSCSSFLKLYNCWKRQIDINTSTWTLDEGWSPLPDMTVQKMCLFLAIIVQMVHDQRDTLKDCWLTLVQYLMALYRNTMKQDRIFHMLQFVHFSDKNELDKTNDNDD